MTKDTKNDDGGNIIKKRKRILSYIVIAVVIGSFIAQYIFDVILNCDNYLNNDT